MRQIFTLISCFALFTIMHAQTPNDEISSPFRFRCSAGAFSIPLFVVDGVIVEEDALKKINPSEIESISVLKNHKAKATFGHAAINGVVVITTKTAHQRVIHVKDAETGEHLPFANLELVFEQNNKDTTIFLQADSNGKVITNKIVSGKEYQLIISYVGYKPFKSHVNSESIGKNYSVFLEKDHSKLSEVVVVSYAGIRCRFCCGIRVIRTKDSIIKKSNVLTEARIYPNPTPGSQNVNVEFYFEKEQDVYVRLFSMDGQLHSSGKYSAIKGINKLSYLIDAKLASGIYVLYITIDKNKIITAGKLFIQ